MLEVIIIYWQNLNWRPGVADWSILGVDLSTWYERQSNPHTLRTMKSFRLTRECNTPMALGGSPLPNFFANITCPWQNQIRVLLSAASRTMMERNDNDRPPPWIWHGSG
jgi:hypothetical protein